MTDIQDADVRKNAYALWMAWQVTEMAIEKEIEPDDARAKREAIENEYFQKKKDLTKWHDAALSELDQSFVYAHRDAAWEAYRNADGPALMEDADGQVVMCAASGLPLWDSDEIVEDPETGETFLRSALGLPSRDMGGNPPPAKAGGFQ